MKKIQKKEIVWSQNKKRTKIPTGYGVGGFTSKRRTRAIYCLWITKETH